MNRTIQKSLLGCCVLVLALAGYTSQTAVAETSVESAQSNCYGADDSWSQCFSMEHENAVEDGFSGFYADVYQLPPGFSQSSIWLKNPAELLY